MLVGLNGTGKTMAAEVLASELYLGLYEIDLSTVVRKYIGETIIQTKKEVLLDELAKKPSEA